MAQIILEFVAQDNASPAAQTIVDSVNKISDSTTNAGSKLDVFGEIATGALRKIGESAINAVGSGLSALGGFITSSIDEASQWQGVLAQTNAVITSTGGAAGKSAQDMVDLASALSAANGQSIFSDDAILGAQNVLATFTGIKGASFDSATQAVLDISQALGTDLQSASIQVGKALNDPIAGVGALSRVGVSFTEQQKAQIKTLQESGDVAGAQAIILAELNKEFGGSAAAAVDTYAGQMTVLSEQMNDVKQGVGEALLPLLTTFGNLLSRYAVPAVEKLAGALTGFIDSIDWAAVFEMINTGFMSISDAIAAFDWDSFVNTVSDLAIAFIGFVAGIDWKTIISTLTTIGGLIVTALIDTFKFLQPYIQRVIDVFNVLAPQLVAIGAGIIAAFQSPAVQSAFAFLKTAVGLVIDIIISLVSTYIQNLINAFNEIAPYVKIAFDLIVRAFNYAAPIMIGVLTGISQFLKGDLNGALTSISNAFSTVWNDITNAVRNAVGSVQNYLDGLRTKFLTAGGEMINGIVRGITDNASRVRDALLNAVSDAWKRVKEFLGIASPSRLMAETVGAPFAQGIAAGIISATPTITGAAEYAGATAAGATINNYYNLTANYANTQSESTILTDLRTLQTIYGGA